MATRDARLVHEECEYLIVDLSVDSTSVTTGPAILYGIYVNTILSAQDVSIQNSTITTLISIQASTAAGTNFNFPAVSFPDSLVINPDNAATGSILVIFRKVNPD